MIARPLPLFDHVPDAPAPRPLPDITRRKHGGNQNSEAANSAVSNFKASIRERVRIFVAGCGFSGATLKETAATLQHPSGRKYFPNELSGRFTELRKDGVIFDNGRELRDGATVYVARKEWVKP
ncbi:MAG: hypothetical protein ACRD3E_15865 [Terriglobales bacterium]